MVLSEATKNYIANPSLELDATGYTNHATGTASGTRARSLAWQKRDAYSYKIDKTAGGASDQYGVSVACSSPTDFVSGNSATFSVDLNITAGTVVIKIEATVGGSPESTTETIIGPAAGRYDVTHLLSGNASAVTAYVYIISATGTFYADGLQVENKAYATTYCDGTRAGCVWTGKPHASASTRSAQVRGGGREYNLSDLGYYVKESPGIGMPSLQHYSFPQAFNPGALLRGYRVGTRTISIFFF